MINLIPPRGHKAVKYEYYFRVASAIGFLFTGVFIFLIVALIPTYVLVGAQIETFKIIGNSESSESDVLRKADQEVQRVKEMLIQLKRVPENLSASVAITEIKTVAPVSIEFNNFAISASDGVIDSVKIQGKAPTRNALAQLKNTLEASDMFEKADVPISDLAQVSDVTFSIDVTLSNQ